MIQSLLCRFNLIQSDSIWLTLLFNMIQIAWHMCNSSAGRVSFNLEEFALSSHIVNSCCRSFEHDLMFKGCVIVHNLHMMFTVLPVFCEHEIQLCIFRIQRHKLPLDDW